MKKQITPLLIFILFCLQLFAGSAYANNSFFNQRYRGWLWFEEKEPALKEKDNLAIGQDEIADHGITAEEARREVESLKQELEDAQYIYLARPNFKTQKAYRDKLGEVMERSQMMQKLWDEQNFIEPEYRNLIDSPENVFAVKLDRKIKAAEDKEIIKKFVDQYELVFFFRESCLKSSEFEPVLKAFSDANDLKVEAVSIDGSKSKYFNSGSNATPRLIEKLGIKATPTVIAVRKDAKRAFELIRGFVTLSELEENVVKAWRIIEEKGINVGVKK